MASYKKPCPHCEGYIETDAKICPLCGMNRPFDSACPSCKRPVSPEYLLCPACGTSLIAGSPAINAARMKDQGK